MSTFENTVDKIGDETFCNQIISKTVTEVKEDRVFKVGSNAFYACSKLTTVDLPNVTSIDASAFYACSLLETVNLPNVTSISSYVFKNCPSLETVNLPNVTSIGGSAFESCTSLQTLDLPKVTNIANSAFFQCSSLATLILRSSKLCAMTGMTTLNSTEISKGNGYIYVPSALVESYKSHTYWGNYANQIRALEDYTVDGTTTGELDSSKI